MQNKKSNKKIIIITIIVIAIIGTILFIKIRNSKKEENTKTTSIVKTNASTQTIQKTLTGSGEIVTSNTEKLSLDTAKYFNTMCVEKGDSVSAGDNILEYTNGTYLTAPYNCVINEVSVPSTGNICKSENYIEIQNTEKLNMTLSINESEIKSVKVGQEAEITIPALNNKTYSGYVTNVSNTAIYSSNGSKFEVTVEFGNDGEVMIGMTGNTQVILNKVENVVVVPTEAVETNNGISTVIVVKDDETSETRTVEIGLSNNAYTEIKTGISEGETIKINKDLTSTNTKTSGNNGQLRENEMNSGRNQSSKNSR